MDTIIIIQITTSFQLSFGQFRISLFCAVHILLFYLIPLYSMADNFVGGVIHFSDRHHDGKQLTGNLQIILQMHKNRLLQLTQVSERSDRIGSKLKQPLIANKLGGKFDPIINKIHKFSNANQEINQLWEEYKKTVNPSKQKQYIHQTTMISKQNSILMREIQQNINTINQTLKKDMQNGNNSDKLKVMQITQNAKTAIQEFKDNQEKFTARVKDNIRRQATIIQGQITEEEVEDIMNNPQKGQQMLEAKLLNGPSVQLENAVSDIIDKYRDILALQKSMQECLQLTQEMALLVALQGQQLDSIQNTIDQTGGYMNTAQVKLIEAKKHHKSAKKKMCCIIMLLLAVIGAILIPVLITQL